MAKIIPFALALLALFAASATVKADDPCSRDQEFYKVYTPMYCLMRLAPPAANYPDPNCRIANIENRPLYCFITPDDNQESHDNKEPPSPDGNPCHGSRYNQPLHCFLHPPRDHNISISHDPNCQVDPLEQQLYCFLGLHMPDAPPNQPLPPNPYTPSPPAHNPPPSVPRHNPTPNPPPSTPRHNPAPNPPHSPPKHAPTPSTPRAQCTRASVLLENCGKMFDRAAHEYCCSHVKYYMNTCYDELLLLGIAERALLQAARIQCRLVH